MEQAFCDEGDAMTAKTIFITVVSGLATLFLWEKFGKKII